MDLKKYFWLIPLIITLILLLNCFVPYIISINTGYVDPILPYVSDAGTGPIACNYFSSFIDINAILVILLGWIRFKQVEFYIKNLKSNNSNDDQQTEVLKKFNLYCMIGCVSISCSMMGAGNFRLSESFYIHWMFGCLVCFATTISIYLYTYTSKILYRFDIETRPITLYIGMILEIIFLTLFIVMAIFASWTNDGDIKSRYEKVLDPSFRNHWPVDHPGYIYHCLSSLSEWLLFLTNILLFLSLSNRFRNFKQWDQIQF